MPGPMGTALFMIGHFLMSFLALHPNREQCVQSLSEADRRVVPVAKIVPGAALIVSGTPTALAKLTISVMVSATLPSEESFLNNFSASLKRTRTTFFSTGCVGHFSSIAECRMS